MNAPPRVLIVIPVYNHAATLRGVVERVLALHPDVLVVDDGSTDNALAALAGLPALAAAHGVNRGKGAAIMTGAFFAAKRGFSHIITMDADGQHDPEDFQRFLPLIDEDSTAIIVGARDFNTPNVPNSSRFGRRFSNFWLRVQTGQALDDVQSGYRAYPVRALLALQPRERRYSFEVEVLVRAAWAGFTLREVPVRVHYPPRSERVSHFNALADNARISLLNTRLTARAMMPLPQKKMRLDGEGRVSVTRPLKSLRILLAKRETPPTLALSAGFGCLVGALPLPGLSCMIILLCSGFTRLNKHAALASNQLCIPPFVQAVSVLVGHYLRHGRWLTEFSVETLGREAGQRLWEWVLGSLVMAPALALTVGTLTYLMAVPVRRTLKGTA